MNTLRCQRLSKTRHGLPDGPVLVRTYPVTFLHDVTQTHRHPGWHTLIYATRGHLEVVVEDRRRIVPADRAVWIPAGIPHTDVMRAPISMRSLFIAAGARRSTRAVRTLAVSPLLRELIMHITRLGALDRRRAAHARLLGVLFDLLAVADDVTLELPSPRDARARRLADRITADPGERRSLAALARHAGASLRTLERTFLVETGLAVGTWRRRVRLIHALHLLERGTPVAAVADLVGYDSTSAFSQAFTRQFGRSPAGRRR